MMQIGGESQQLEENFRRDMETLAQAPDLFFSQFSLATNHFGNDAACSEDVQQVFLFEAVLLH